MANEDLKAAFHSAVAAAEDSALDDFASGVLAAAPASPGGFTQDQMDAAVAKAVSDAQAADAADKAQAIADVQSKLDSAMSDLAALQVKEGQEASVIASAKSIQDQLAQMQATFAQLFPPAPAPVDPAPADTGT